MKEKLKLLMAVTAAFLAGILAGGYALSDTAPRSLLSFQGCKTLCLDKKELIGLLASVGVQKLPKAIPQVVLETDKTLVIQYPFRQERIHYVLIPKRDIKNVAEIAESDIPYLVDLFSVVRELVQREHLIDYKLYSNGPGYQEMTYLHFHLVAS